MGNFDVVLRLHAVSDINCSYSFSTYLIGNTVSCNYYPRHGNLREISLVNTVVRKGLTPSLSHTKLVTKHIVHSITPSSLQNTLFTLKNGYK
jgi:hypothetical protein